MHQVGCRLKRVAWAQNEGGGGEKETACTELDREMESVTKSRREEGERKRQGKKKEKKSENLEKKK